MRKLFILLAAVLLANVSMAQSHTESWHPAKVILTSEYSTQETEAQVILTFQDEEALTLSVLKDGQMTRIDYSITNLDVKDNRVVYTLDKKSKLVMLDESEGVMCKMTIRPFESNLIWDKIVLLFYM